MQTTRYRNMKEGGGSEGKRKATEKAVKRLLMMMLMVTGVVIWSETLARFSLVLLGCFGAALYFTLSSTTFFVVDDDGMWELQHDDQSGGWPQTLAMNKERKRNSLDSITGVTFCGCGFLGVYLVGAAAYMQQYHPRLLQQRLGGSSVGSIVAVTVACGVPLQDVRELILAEARTVRGRLLGALDPRYTLEEPLMTALLRLLPEDAHIRASGRVFLSLTRASTLGNVVVSEYPSRNELIKAVMCCCFLPLLSGYTAPSFRGKRYIDGGMSNNMPLKGWDIISVNAFAGEFEICPPDEIGDLRPLSRYLNQCLSLSNSNLYKLKCGLWPPEPEELDQQFHLGYIHARNFFSPPRPQRSLKYRTERVEE